MADSHLGGSGKDLLGYSLCRDGGSVTTCSMGRRSVSLERTSLCDRPGGCRSVSLEGTSLCDRPEGGRGRC